MKKRVRIYKAQDGGEGMYVNPMSNFIARAQAGAQTQADPQQLVMQVANLVAPPPYGEGQDPNELYKTLAQSYGEEMAAQIINAAAAFVQQQIGSEEQGSTQQPMQEENPDLNYQEELLREEQERAEEAYNNSIVAEDEAAFDEMLFSENPALQEEETQMKLGGFQKQFVRKAMKLAKKALGDTGTQNTSKADPTDILNGRSKATGDFITTIQNQATLAKVQQQAENIARTAVQPNPTFQQMGGYTGGDLFKFVYGGGDDPSIPQLTQAQTGVEIKDSTGKTKSVTQEEADLWNQATKDNPTMTLEDLSFASESPVAKDPNWNVWKEMITKGYGKNLGDYREGIDYSGVSDMFNKGVSASNLIPTNKIFNKTYTMSGMLDPRELIKQGFTMDKQRIGPGHKRYTFTPTGSDRVTAQNKDQFKDDNWSRRDDRRSVRDQLGKNYKLGQFFQNVMSSKVIDRSPKLRNWIDQKRSEKLNVPFLEPKAYGGLPSYQGVNTGSAVNTQDQPIEFKPKSSKEVWAKVEPELRQQYGLGEKKDPELIKQLKIDEETSFNGENFLNTFNPVMRSITKGIELYGQRDNARMFNENLDSTNQASAVDPQFRGNYNPNSGLFREDQMGQLWQSAEGGQRRKTGQQSDWGLGVFPTAMGGSDINQYLGMPKPQVQDSLTAVSRDEANLEAEGGETAFGDINGDGFPEHMKIVGPRHSSGGVPLNLPDDTFIFSDTRSMKISDPKILKMFNKPAKKGGYTPAELAKPYDINKYRKILDDPDSDVVDRKTAELMIKNFNVKLGALALAQESKKGFPQGIPVVARPYMEMMGLKDEDFIPEEENEQAQSFSPSPEEISMMQQVDETGMPPMDQMAMQQADMSGMPMEGMPMAAYGMSMGGYSLPFAQNGMFIPPPPYENMSIQDIDRHNEMFIDNAPDLSFKGKPDIGFGIKTGLINEPWYNMNHKIKSGLTEGRYNNQFDKESGIWRPDHNQYISGQQYKNGGYLNKAVYGMSMGGYDMPFAQEGLFVDDMYVNTINEPMVTDEMSNRNRRISQKPYYHVEPHSIANPNPDRYWLTAGDRLRNLRAFITGQKPTALNSGVSYAFQDGGELEMYQDKGEVKAKNKTYTDDTLPEGANVKTPTSTDIRIGDYIKQPDGTYLKVTKANFQATSVNTKTKPGTAAEFIAMDPANKSVMDQANAIIEREIKKGTIKNNNGKITVTGNLNLPFKEQIIVSRALNSNAQFGTDKYKVVTQKSTPGYSAGKGKGSFVAGFTPEMYEQRYIFEKARGQGASDDQAFAEVDRVMADPKAKAKLRREYLAFLGVQNVPSDDTELLSTNFYKTRYGDVTKGLEGVLSKAENRPVMGDDLWAGWEHYDALGLSPEFQYEGLPEEEKQKIKDREKALQEEEDYMPQYAGEAPWWLQDQIKMAGAFGDLMSINKYYPWAPKYQPLVPEPTFLDPTRSIAAQSEQAKILGDTMAQFSPSASLAAGRLSGIQGQLAKGVADTETQYDTANVQIANQFAPVQADTYNKAQMYNQGVSKQLYDANTIMNQQYDNAKRALRNNLLNQYTNAITNRWKTDALNQMYPQFAVDPSVGGQMYYTGQPKKIRPEASKTLAELYQEYYDATGDREAAQKFAMLQYKQNQSGYGSDDLYPAEAMMSLYGNMQTGGSFTFGPGMLPPMIL